jgi:ABC-2 type transport system permease protein
MNKFTKELNAVVTIAMRDIILALKSPSRIGMALIWPVMMLGMFGSQLSQNMGINMGFDFNQFMLIGMLVNGLFMMSIYGITSLVEDRENDFTQELLVSPISRYSIILGKIVGASFVGYVQFFATILVGLCIGARISGSQLLFLLALSPLINLAAGSLGVLCVGLIHKSSTAGLVAMLLSMFQMFLSGALIPINHSTGFMAVLSRLLPMTYCIDLTRGLFYGGSPGAATMYAPAVNLIIVGAFTAVFFIVGTTGFVRAEKIR